MFSAATSRVLTAPASTETTTSSVGSSVMRRPSTCRFSIPATFSAASISLPPPCTIDERRPRAGDRLHGGDDRRQVRAILEQLAAELEDERSGSHHRVLNTKDTKDTKEGKSLTFVSLVSFVSMKRWNNPEATSQQPRPLVEAEHHVHVLHGLARRALQQVVDHRHQNRAAATASTRQPMSQKFVCATCLISGSAEPTSRTNVAPA